jgi:hypothetical protein
MANMGPHDKDHWNEWLDKALQQYGDAQPRPGLESRVLANLEAHQRRHTGQIWAWALAGVVMTIFPVLFLWHGLDHSDLHKHDDEPVARASQDSRIEQRTHVPPPISQNPTARVRKGLRPVITEHGGNPRLEQFPSPRPLSPQELAALRYAGQYPREAVLVAKEQEKFDDEVQQAQQQVETSLSISAE